MKRIPYELYIDLPTTLLGSDISYSEVAFMDIYSQYMVDNGCNGYQTFHNTHWLVVV